MNPRFDQKHGGLYCLLRRPFVKQYPTEHVILVMDDVSDNESASGVTALSLFTDRVAAIWLLFYCSELNAIERFWGYVKDRACVNHLEDQIEYVLVIAEKALSGQNNLTAEVRNHVSKTL